MFAVAGFDWVNSESDALVSYDSFSGGGFMQWDAGNAHRFESRVWHHSNSGSLTSHKFYPQSDMGPALYQVSFDYEMGTMHGLLNGQSLGTTDYQTAVHPRHVLRLFANKDLNQFPKGFVAEFMVFDEALSEVDRKLVESYLGEKWALPMHDPIEHPLFKMEENGTLVTREELDFEIDENHTITVRVFDEYNASYDKEFLVSVTNIVEDLDGDGVENHYDTDDDNDSIPDELDPDDDNDGFSDADELAYGSDPLDPNSVANAFPNFLDLNGTTIFENQPIGTRVGQLIAHDPDSNALLAFSFVDGNGSDNNSLFVIDENATVRTTTIFDYETDDHNYSIRVGVADEHNFSIEHSFTIKLLNIIEDNDRDGVEDHYDPDDDNDGFSDLDELDYGSDPLDPNSVANAAPDSLELNGSTVLENQPISALVGQLIGHDPDGNTTLTFSFVDGNGSGDNSLFVIDENATVRTTTMFDYETDDHNYSIRVGVSDEHNFSIERSFTINLLNIVEDHDQDGVEDHYDPDDDNDGFSDLDELAYGADPLDSKSVANAAPDSLELNGSTVLENLPIGSLVGELIGHDPDENTTLTYRFVDGNGSGDNSLFVIDENASVRTTTIFDYERDDHNYSILVRIADEHNFSIDRTFTLLLLNQNEPPFDFKSSADLEVKENQAMGSLVGKLTAKDPDMDSVLHFKLVEGAKDNHLFRIDNNGSLFTGAVFDFETNSSFEIRAKVRDRYNLWIKQNFTIKVLNIIEDFDKDGTENHYDLDDDNDGFSDADELAYGSDPQDPESLANSTPDLLKLNGSTIMENQPIGTIIGRLVGHDPDPYATLSYSQVLEGNGNVLPLDVGPMGVVRTTKLFDYESNDRNYTLVARVTDEHNFSTERSFTIDLVNQIEDLDQDGVEDVYDEDIDGDGFSNEDELAYGSDPYDLRSVVNVAPIDIVIEGGEIEENRPTGTLVARFFGIDADKNDSLTYQLVGPGNIEESLPFKLSKRGGLRTTRKLDYELDKHDYSMTIQVLDDMNESFEKSFTIYLINQIEDIDGDGTEDAYDDDLDGDGYANELELEIGTNPTDRYSRPEKPILRAGSGQIDKNGTIFLTGGIKANGGAEISDFGFVLSSSVSLDRDKSTVYWVRGVGKAKDFKLTVTESPFPGTLYFRTWARNVAGYGIGPVKKVIIPEAPQPWWGEVEEAAGGWLTSSWFGTFKYYENGWLYHSHLGWLYSSPSNENSVWLWIEGRGWMWTKESAWPYLWWHNTNIGSIWLRANRGNP